MIDINASDWKKLCEVMNGYVYSLALSTACELNLFDWLAKNPNSTQKEIAKGISLSLHSTRILLLSICSTELIVRDRDTSAYSNSELADQVLVFASPLSMLSYIRFNRQVQLQGCLHFPDALREDRNAGLDEFPGTGDTLYARLKAYPEMERLFQEGMGNYTRLSPQMIEVSEFSRAKHLLDIGGGDGTNAIRLCRQYPRLKVTIMELPSVCSIGEQNVERMGMSNQIQFIQADMFTDPWPTYCDTILMSHIVEILSVEKISSLYRKAYDVLPQNGLLFIWTLMTDDLESGGLQAAKAAIYLFSVASGEGMPWPAVEHTRMLKEAGFEHPLHYEAQEIDHGLLISEK